MKKNQQAGGRTYQCSFCGKSQEQVERLIAGPGGVFICDECIDLCREIIEEEHVTSSRTQARDKAPGLICGSCGTACSETYIYCFHCGQKLLSVP